MIYRRFGRTKINMPVFSCGGMRFQFKWEDLPFNNIPKENQENVEKTILYALDLGINHIETARGYGTSELQLGKILSTLKRNEIIVQTKVSPTEDPKDFVRNFETSLENLKLDHVDLLALHGINNEETFRYSMGACLDEAEKLKKKGLVRFIGFSSHAQDTSIIKNSILSRRFDYLNLHWYYIYQQHWPAILSANKLNMGVFIISPSDKGGMLYQPSQKLTELCTPLSPMVFNDLFCLSHPQIHTLSIGAARPKDFNEHLKTLNYLRKAKKHLKLVQKRLQNAAIETLGEEWLNTWQIGLPSHEETPGNINIPIILWLRNLVLAYDVLDYAKMRYNLLGGGDHWFPGSRAEDVKDLKDCLKNSPHAEVIPDLLRETHQLLGAESVKRLSESDTDENA